MPLIGKNLSVWVVSYEYRFCSCRWRILGAIQIPADGQPIVLMQDRQTIGGYPKMGSVIAVDLRLLAQVGEGAKVRFEPVSVNEAQQLSMLEQHRRTLACARLIGEGP